MPSKILINTEREKLSTTLRMSINSRIWIGFSLSTHNIKYKRNCTHAVYWVGSKFLWLFHVTLWPTPIYHIPLTPGLTSSLPFFTQYLLRQLTLGWCNLTSPQLSYTDYIAFCQYISTAAVSDTPTELYSYFWACWQTLAENEKVTPESHPLSSEKKCSMHKPFPVSQVGHLQLPMAVTSSIQTLGLVLLSPLLSSSVLIEPKVNELWESSSQAQPSFFLELSQDTVSA